MTDILFITLGGLLGAKFSAGMRTVGARAQKELGADWRHYRWNQGKKAARDAANFKGIVVVAWHSAGADGAAVFVRTLNRKIALAFAVDSWLKNQKMNPLIDAVYSITAGKGGRYNVVGANVVEEIIYPNDTHTEVDDDPELHDLIIKTMRQVMNDQSTSPTPVPAIVPFSGFMTGNEFDRETFFDAVRETVFGGRIGQPQVDGLNRLLGVWEEYYFHWDMRELAYDLATGYHETGDMQPIYEGGSLSYFDKYEPGTRLGKVLGNTVAGDGYKFRGAGDVQNTGRGNAAKATRRLNEKFNLGIDLVANPEMRLDPFISGHSLFLGNHEGWWTTLKLPNYVGYGQWNMEGARGVVNGSDRWEMIGGYAGAFLDALKLSAAQKLSAPVPAPLPADPSPGLPDPGDWGMADLRQNSSENLRKTIALSVVILQERAEETETKATIMLPKNEEEIMSVFNNSKSIFKSKRFWGFAVTTLGLLFPNIKPVVELLTPTLTGATPEMVDQLQSSSAEMIALAKQIVAVIGAVVAAWGGWKANTTLKLK